MRKTKIVCTLGPAVDNEQILSVCWITSLMLPDLTFLMPITRKQLTRLNRLHKGLPRKTRKYSLLTRYKRS